MGVYIVIPGLLHLGMPFFIGYLIGFQTIPFIILFVQMLYLYHHEQRSMDVRVFIHRMRLTWNTRIVFIGIGVFIFGLLTYLPLQSMSRILAASNLFAPPAWFPADIHPLKQSVEGEFMGFPMHGKFFLPWVYMIGWGFNITGEELLFRGYLLPRQELTYGTYAWLINGILWNVWHLFWRWQMAALLPFHLLLTYAVQRTRSTTVGLIGHGLINFIAVILLIRLSLC
jgi:membrane protease YdiL (CAAX protease family)